MLPRYRGGNGTYTIDIYEPEYSTTEGPEVGMQYENNEQQNAYGIYLQDQLDLTDNLKVMLGLRFDEIEQDIFETKSGVLVHVLVWFTHLMTTLTFTQAIQKAFYH